VIPGGGRTLRARWTKGVRINVTNPMANAAKSMKPESTDSLGLGSPGPIIQAAAMLATSHSNVVSVATSQPTVKKSADRVSADRVSRTRGLPRGLAICFLLRGRSWLDLTPWRKKRNGPKQRMPLRAVGVHVLTAVAA
jgi:hypothetical protein